MTTLDHSKDEHLDLLEWSRILKVAELIGLTITLLPGVFLAMILEKQASDCYINFTARLSDEFTAITKWHNDTSDPHRSL